MSLIVERCREYEEERPRFIERMIKLKTGTAFAFVLIDEFKQLNLLDKDRPIASVRESGRITGNLIGQLDLPAFMTNEAKTRCLEHWTKKLKLSENPFLEKHNAEELLNVFDAGMDINFQDIKYPPLIITAAEMGKNLG